MEKSFECDDAISREAALEKMADYVASGYADSAEDFEEYSRIICQLPSVTPKSETVTEFADRCRECGARYGKLLEQKAEAIVNGTPIQTGKWNEYYTSQKGNDVFNCKECGHTFVVTQGKYNMNFCPNCGCRMVEPQESEDKK